jgi:hypothetical protein
MAACAGLDRAALASAEEEIALGVEILDQAISEVTPKVPG